MNAVDMVYILERLADQRRDLNYEAFKMIWKDNDHLAEHFWFKFSIDHKHDIPKFFGYLDYKNRDILARYLAKEIGVMVL